MTVWLVEPEMTDVEDNVTTTVEVTGTVPTLVSVESDTVPTDVIVIVDPLVKVVRTAVAVPSVRVGAIVKVTGNDVVSVKTVENVVPEWVIV